MQEFNRFLIVRTDGIGDVLLTLPMAHVLRKKFPNSHIAMLIRRYTAELLEDNKNINQILFYDKNAEKLSFFKLIEMLRNERFDVVFHTYPRFRLALITRFAGIPFRVGTGYRWYSFLFNKKVYEHRKYAQRHESEYNLNLLKTVGCNIDSNIMVSPALEVKPDSLEKIRAAISGSGIKIDQQLIIIHPGSGGSARNWSAKKFGMLGEKLAQLKNVAFIITGRQNEAELVHKVKSLINGTVLTFVDQLSLKEYAALAKLANLLIANSTGPIHIAAAVGTPVIGLYPQIVPLSPKRWAPCTDKKTIFTPKNKPIDCKKCNVKKAYECECMESITVDEVYEAALKYINNS